MLLRASGALVALAVLAFASVAAAQPVPPPSPSGTSAEPLSAPPLAPLDPPAAEPAPRDPAAPPGSSTPPDPGPVPARPGAHASPAEPREPREPRAPVASSRRARAHTTTAVADTGSSARAEEPEPVVPAPRDIVHLFEPQLGVRLVAISHDGFEPYGSRDVNVLAQIALGVTFFPLHAGPFALGVGPEYDVGRRASTVRGDAVSLVVHRLAATVIADVALIRYVHVFSRLAPSAHYLHGAITDAAIARPLLANAWTWGFDLSAGVNTLLASIGPDATPDAAMWASLEGGYAFAGEVPMHYAPAEDSSDPRQFGATDLPPVAPAGALIRIGLAASF